MALKVTKKVKKEYDYIPVSQRDEENPVVVTFRVLPKEDKAKLEDKLLRVHPDKTVNIANATFILDVFKLSVIDIKGLEDENGKAIKITHDEEGLVADEVIDYLPDDFIQEVGQTIVAVSKDPKNAELFLGEVKQK